MSGSSSWPAGNKEKHAAAARKGWETRRKNATEQHIPIGATTRARDTSKPETRNKAPGMKAAIVKGKREREKEFRTLVTVMHENADDVSKRLGGIDTRIVAAAKRDAEWFYKWVEIRNPDTGIVRGHWDQIRYPKKARRK